MPLRWSLPFLGVILSTFGSFTVLHQIVLDTSSTVLLTTEPVLQQQQQQQQKTPQTPLSPPPPPIAIRYRQTSMPYFLREAMSHGNMLCRDVAEHQNQTRNALPTLLPVSGVYSLQLECGKLFYQNSWGTGNVLQALYGIRLAARVLGQVQIKIRCKDSTTTTTQSELVVPWMAGNFAPRSSGALLPSLEQVCLNFGAAPVHLLMDEIRYELRRMAIALVGIPYPTHPAADFELLPEREDELQIPMPAKPLFPDIQLDDVVIHFRCGDIIETTPHYQYGYTRFSFLANLISPQATTIGIVTQPFQGQHRRMDGTNHTRCPILIHAFKHYLQQHFPQAAIQLRNAPTETIALSYARFIMANQTLAAGISTFTYFPFMATFGTGYLQKPLYVSQDFEQHVNARFIEYDDENWISSVRLFELWKETNGQEQILNWFTAKVSSDDDDDDETASQV